MAEDFLSFYLGQKAEQAQEASKKREVGDLGLHLEEERQPVQQRSERVAKPRQVEEPEQVFRADGIQEQRVRPVQQKRVEQSPRPVQQRVRQPVQQRSERIAKPVEEQPVQRPRESIQQPVQPVQREQKMQREGGPVQGRELEELFLHSETPPELREEWVQAYLNSFRTRKKGYVVEKCKKGLFRLSEDRKLEILSDYDTYGKDVADVLRDLTKPGRTMFNNRVT